MAWTAPKTWVAGAILPASEMNTYVRDNTNYLKSEVDSHHILAGTSTVYAKSGGVLYKSVTSQANTTTTETTLFSQSIAANTLSADKQALVLNLAGSNAANDNVKTLRVKFGATTVTLHSTAGNGEEWQAWVTIARTGAATQTVDGILTGASQSTNVNTTAGETLSGAVTLSVTGQATDTNDITLTRITVLWEPAGN